jgi:hypothetical protein
VSTDEKFAATYSEAEEQKRCREVETSVPHDIRDIKVYQS